MTNDLQHIGDSPVTVEDWPRVTCQHRWKNDGIVLTSKPPIYPQTCQKCGATRSYCDGKAYDYHERKAANG
jgi:MinD superfamily P-loop ATPase